MGKKRPCCEKNGLKKGPWSPEEDQVLANYITQHGHGRWRSLPKLAGLLRCGKSCRLRWTNYLRPDIKRGPFTEEEEKLVIQLHGILGNRWAAIAAQLPGRTDNEIKNLWNTHLKKRLLLMGIDPQTHEPFVTCYGPALTPATDPSTRHMAQWESARLEAEARLSKESLMFGTPPPFSDHFLRLWNSEVGEAFRGTSLASPGSHSQLSSTVKGCDSMSGTTTDVAQKQEMEVEMEMDAMAAGGSACSSSDELDDSSDSALRLLMDYSLNIDMSFLADHVGPFASFD
ncbi:unnamed protein product [Rhodiola kirilowii]